MFTCLAVSLASKSSDEKGYWDEDEHGDPERELEEQQGKLGYKGNADMHRLLALLFNHKDPVSRKPVPSVCPVPITHRIAPFCHPLTGVYTIFLWYI